MRTAQRWDREKTIEVLLYIAAQTNNLYKVLKVLYFADKDHLARYGRLICGDSYVAMRLGPVPSGAYDLIKDARGEGCRFPDIDVTEAFVVRDGREIVPRRKADAELLSESDVECLDAAIERCRHLSFGQLKRLSHDDAYRAADENDFIPLEAIIKTLPNSDALLDYVRGN